MAHFVENAAGDRLAEAASLLAHHWREAGDDQQTLRYLVMAAEHASRTWAKSEAVSLYTQALQLVPEQEGARRKSLLLRRGITLLESGKFTAAADELDAVRPLQVMSRWRRFSGGRGWATGSRTPRRPGHRPAEPQNWLIRWARAASGAGPKRRCAWPSAWMGTSTRRLPGRAGGRLLASWGRPAEARHPPRVPRDLPVPRRRVRARVEVSPSAATTSGWRCMRSRA